VNFIRKLPPGRKAAVFGTSAGTGGTKCAIEKLLAKKGVTVSGGFHCPGSSLLYQKGRPNERI